MKMHCIVGDSTGNKWEEELEVESVKTAKADIECIIKSFNDTLRPGELPRKLIKVLRAAKPESKANIQYADFMSLLQDLRLENDNAYGSVWLKANYTKVMRAYNTMLDTGKSRMLNKYIKQVFGNVHDIPEKLRYLSNEDI